MLRPVINQVQGFRTQDGAGVSLVRVLGNETKEIYDPFLMLDAFDSTDPKDYIAGFPMHPHRGIETFTFLSKEKKEAAAHFANLYVQGTYPKAVSFMARECQVLTMTMVLYVKSIR